MESAQSSRRAEGVEAPSAVEAPRTPSGRRRAPPAGSTPVPGPKRLWSPSRPGRRLGAERPCWPQDPLPGKAPTLLPRSSAPEEQRGVRSRKKCCFLGKISPRSVRNSDDFQRKGLTGDTHWELESRGNAEEGACDPRARGTSRTGSPRKAVCAGGALHGACGCPSRALPLGYTLQSFSGKFSVMRWSPWSSTTMFTSNSGKTKDGLHSPARAADAESRPPQAQRLSSAGWCPGLPCPLARPSPSPGGLHLSSRQGRRAPASAATLSPGESRGSFRSLTGLCFTSQSPQLSAQPRTLHGPAAVWAPGSLPGGKRAEKHWVYWFLQISLTFLKHLFECSSLTFQQKLFRCYRRALSKAQEGCEASSLRTARAPLTCGSGSGGVGREASWAAAQRQPSPTELSCGRGLRSPGPEPHRWLESRGRRPGVTVAFPKHHPDRSRTNRAIPVPPLL